MTMNGDTLLSEAFGGEWLDSPAPVWRRLADAASQYPDKLALACLHQPAGLYSVGNPEAGYLQWTYSQLDTTAKLLAAGLEAQGLSSRSSVVSILRNGAEFPLAFWAAHRIGRPFVPINPRNLANATETRHMLAVADVAAVIVESPELAAEFDTVHHINERKTIKIVAGERAHNGWITIPDLLAIGKKATLSDKDISDTRKPEPDSEKTVTVLFTSGTTSLPKGCPHTNLSLNAFMKNLGLGGSSPNDTFCSVLPNNHAMGYFYVLHFLCNGGAVVYPSAAFEAAQMAKALALHSCTHACLVPTALHSLLDHTGQNGQKFPALQDVCLAGASITPHHMRHVIKGLGARGVSTGFGMTEGSPVWTVATPDPEMLIIGDDTISGHAAPGARIRICAPGSTEPLPRGQSGEIHESGPGVIANYLGTGVGSESFWVDDQGRTWFRTGDRAVMHPDGRVSIVGRYKDMIIRGGENLAPAAIEGVLNQFPGVDAQIVAATDPIAGEVPVAVIRKFPTGDNPSGALQDSVRKTMGVLYVPDEIIPLNVLGLDEYPRTMSGKIQKATLRSLVSAYRQNRNPKPEAVNGFSKVDSSDKSIEQRVLHVWWRATGIEPSKLDKEAHTFNFADSITIMRVREMYRKELGVTLSASEMAEHASLRSQIAALQRKTTPSTHDSFSDLPVSIEPPTLDEIQAVIGPENNATVFKKTASAALAKQGFDFDRDAESVIQSSDFSNVLLKEKIMLTWNFSIAIVAEGSTVQVLKEALTAALKNNNLFTSFYVHGQDGWPFYITMKPQQKLYDQCLIEAGSVATAADLQQLAIQYPHPEHSVHPGPLFHALIYKIEDTQSAGFVFNIHHIVHDASSMRLVLEDLNQALLEPARPLRPHVPFQLWADIYHSLRDSPRAMLEVDWHVKRLANLHLHRKALYPPAHVPRKEITSSPDGIDYGFDAPSLLNLKRHHPHITASVVLKAAMALVNITRTHHTHAVFSNFEACRSTFPFWPKTLRHIPSTSGTTLADLDASDVAGPTMNAVTNLIPIPHDEPAISFLTRIQAEQTELTKHAHAPWRHVIRKLNAMHPGEYAGEMVHEAHRTQFLTWVPGFLGDYEKIRVAQIAIRAALGLVFVAGLGGPRATTYMISLRWDVANYSAGEVRDFVQDVEKAIGWLLDEGSWEVPVGEFLKRFE